VSELTELRFYIPLDTKCHFGDVPQANVAHSHQSEEMYNKK